MDRKKKMQRTQNRSINIQFFMIADTVTDLTTYTRNEDNNELDIVNFLENPYLRKRGDESSTTSTYAPQTSVRRDPFFPFFLLHLLPVIMNMSGDVCQAESATSLKSAHVPCTMCIRIDFEIRFQV
jgi:hypothetical protein